MKGSWISMAQLDSKRPKDALRLNSSLETLLYSTFPPLSHAYPRTSPGTTNTDVLFSISLLYFSYSKRRGPPGSRPASLGLKWGQSRTGSVAAVWLPTLPSPTWKHTSDFSFQGQNCSEKAARLADSLTSDSFSQWVIIAENYTTLCNPYEQTLVEKELRSLIKIKRIYTTLQEYSL